MTLAFAAALALQLSPNAAAEAARWQETGRSQIAARAGKADLTRPAKNVIIFLADGVGPTFHTAARIHALQTGHPGAADGRLSFDDFPNAAFAQTYATDDYVADSAASATAILSGIKTVNGAVSVPAGYGPEHCGSPAANPPTLGELAAATGRATGVVTTSILMDASPAAFYAHAPTRNWVMDERVPEPFRKAGCRGIVEQLMAAGTEVALGGGRLAFAGESWKDPETGNPGARDDDRNLMQDWQARKNAKVVLDRAGILALKGQPLDRLLGLFAPLALFDEEEQATNPTLTEMTLAAIDVLERDPDGYVLFVEEEGTDEHQHTGHLNAAFASYLAFDSAIAAALERIDLSETLVIVTSDHGQPIAMAGPAASGEPIVGLSKQRTAKGVEPVTAEDQKAFPVLGFYVGPQPQDGPRPDPASQNMADPGYVWPSAVPREFVPHSGVDVGVFAAGPGSELISGVMDQHAIFHAIARAMGDPGRG